MVELGGAPGPSSHEQPAVDHPSVRHARDRRRADGTRPRPSARGRRRRRPGHPRRGELDQRPRSCARARRPMNIRLEGSLTKEPGALKEAHEAGLAVAPPLFDIETYVEEFGASIVPAYREGIADAEWPADVGLARSVVPPGTAATRDFSRLAPRIPQLIAEQCVGCMACVSACPDSAILGIAVPESDLDTRIASFAET